MALGSPEEGLGKSHQCPDVREFLEKKNLVFDMKDSVGINKKKIRKPSCALQCI